LQIAADGPAQLLERLEECCVANLPFRIIGRSPRREHADASHPLALLRPRRQRPRRRRAAAQRDDLAPAHPSITSSAPPSSVRGLSGPSVLAVFRLMISSYLVAACTGRSAGFSPLRTRST